MQMRGLQVLKHHEKNFNLCANQHILFVCQRARATIIVRKSNGLFAPFVSLRIFGQQILLIKLKKRLKHLLRSDYFGDFVKFFEPLAWVYPKYRRSQLIIEKFETNPFLRVGWD